MAADTASVPEAAVTTSTTGTSAPVAGIGATKPKYGDFLDPATAVGTIVLGVMAGIIATLVLGLCAWFFTDRIVPLLQGLVYRGVDLAGRWTQSKTNGAVSYHYTLDLRQNAHRLKGGMTISKSGSGTHDYTQDFEVTGRTWEGFVMLDLISKNRRSLSFATTLLQVSDRGNELVGHMAYRSALPPDHVDSESCTWVRTA